MPTRLHETQVEAAGAGDLVLRGITKTYRSRNGHLHVLDHINLRVKRGEFICLLGPSGCGKSTLFNIIAGLERPDGGEIHLGGRPIDGPGPDRVVVFQEGALFPWLTVLGNVEFGLEMIGVPQPQRREKARSALNMVHLSRFEDAWVHELSGGMRQRVAIARAVAMDPDILLMDEPFAALDAQTRNVMQQEIQRIWLETGKTIIFVTHNVAEALRLGDRVLVLSFRPSCIKRDIPVLYPRPRLPEDPHISAMRSFLLRELQTDVKAAVQEELDDD